MNNSTSPGYLDLYSAAQWVSVSVKTLRRWLTRGLPFFQESPGSKILIRPEWIEEFLRRRQTHQSNLEKMVDELASEIIGDEKVKIFQPINQRRTRIETGK